MTSPEPPPSPSRVAQPLCAYARCAVRTSAGVERALPAWPVLVLPADDDDARAPWPAGFEVVPGTLEVEQLAGLPLLGLAPTVRTRSRTTRSLAIPARATDWLAPDAARLLHGSELVRQASASWLVGDASFDLALRPRVMGVVNVTPNSFSDGGLFASTEAAIAHGRQLAAEGADVLDIGGESTRPGAHDVDAAVELERVLPVVRTLAGELGARVPVSIDTRKACVARAALEAGARIVNDVSALGHDAQMAPLVARTGASLILMHMRGQPTTMQDDTDYDDLFAEVVGQLEQQLSLAYDAGVDLRRVLVDPGIGFGKRLQQNLELVAGMRRLWALGRPGLLGASRKRFLGELTGRAVTERTYATVAAVTAGVLAGAAVVRVHDVGACLDAVRVATSLRGHDPFVAL